MATGKPIEPALGVPGQVAGRATLQSDRGDETQALFIYQWAAGVTLLVGALASLNNYVAVWCEYHDDLLGELPSGTFHAVQVKTKSGQNARWKCADDGFGDAIRKFSEHEAKYAAKIEKYIFFSNASPYVPAATVKKSSALASSPMRLRDECRKATAVGAIPVPYKASFDALVKHTGADQALVFQVLRKLDFHSGVPLEGFRDHLRNVVGGLPACRHFTLDWLDKVRDDLLFLVGNASSLAIASLDFYASILQSDGRPATTVRGKRISVEDFESALKQHPSSGFRYAEVGEHLQLGKASGQKEVLRQKMNAGYVGSYFPAMWLQAMSAEQRLLEEANVDPEAALRKAKQLERVMLVECQTAEVEAALEPDERKRGTLILQKVIRRADELARHDRASVEGERAETLRGVAGLLSGSCKFAWGVPIDGEEQNGP